MFVPVSRLVLAIACAAVFATSYVARAADEKKGKAATSASQFDVPSDGTPDELLAFIKKTQKTQATGTRQERINHIRNANQAIVTAAERIQKAEADDKTTTAALKAEFDALTMLKRLGDNDAAKRLEALSDELKNDKRPAVANMLKLQSLQRRIENAGVKDPDAVASFVAEATELIQSAPPEPQFLPVAQAAIMMLHRNGQSNEAAKLAEKFAKRFVSSDDADLVAGSVQMVGPAAQILTRLGRADEADRLYKQYFDELAKRKEPAIEMATMQLAMLAGQSLESQGKEKEAAKLYREVAKQMADSDNPQLRQLATQIEDSARKLELVGQPMPISGKLVDGGEFDIAQYKGKVVLVDFWATWCGPCVKELPNVKETYAKFHDRGFEVVGISLDEDVNTLTKFIKGEQIPWPILFEGGEETSGWNHPLAKRYGVNAIPMAVLVNREGNVVTLSARDKKLGELVEQLLGDENSDNAGSKKVIRLKTQ
jgi:peroxiredoxin